MTGQVIVIPPTLQLFQRKLNLREVLEKIICCMWNTGNALYRASSTENITGMFSDNFYQAYSASLSQIGMPKLHFSVPLSLPFHFLFVLHQIVRFNPVSHMLFFFCFEARGEGGGGEIKDK